MSMHSEDKSRVIVIIGFFVFVSTLFLGMFLAETSSGSTFTNSCLKACGDAGVDNINVHQQLCECK